MSRCSVATRRKHRPTRLPPLARRLPLRAVVLGKALKMKCSLVRRASWQSDECYAPPSLFLGPVVIFRIFRSPNIPVEIGIAMGAPLGYTACPQQRPAHDVTRYGSLTEGATHGRTRTKVHADGK